MSTSAADVVASGVVSTERSTQIDDLELQVRAEQIRHIYSQTPAFVPAVFFGAVMTIVMLWPTTTPVVAIAWCAWIWLVYAIFLLMWRRWKVASPDDAAMLDWARPYTLMGWVATASWGMAGILFFHPESFIHQSMLLMSLVIGSAAITATSTAYSPTFYTVVMMLLPLSARLLYEGGIIYQLLSAGMWVLLIMLFFLHRNTHAAYASALRTRFLNETLARQLAVQKELAEQANSAKSRFLAAASHDLRQPLHALGLFLGELQARIDDPKARARLLERMGLSVESMTDLFNAILDISRFDAGAVRPEMRSFNINELMTELQREYVLHAHDKGLMFHCVPCNVIVCSDPLLLRRMLRNLLDNAVRYTRHGKVLMGCRRKQGFVELQVWDTGIGIPPKDSDEIFTEFHQLQNPERDRSKGLGLGLSVVRQLGRILKHKVSLHSVPGKGSVFSLRIPVGDAGNSVSLNEIKPAPVKDTLRTACVLVIDDEATVRESMRGLLEAWGCTVISASSAAEALSELAAGDMPPDVVICDYRLRNGQSGIDAIAALRDKAGGELPAVLVTGDTADESRRAARQADVALLHKPVNPARLSTLLRYLLDSRSD